MTALRVDSIDFDTRRFDIHRTDEHDGGTYKDGTPKNHKRRTVPFPSSLVPELQELTKNKAPGDRVFQSDRGKMLRGSNFRGRQYRASARPYPKERANLPASHHSRPPTHGSKHRHPSRSQCKSGPAHAGTRQCQDDAGHLRGSL